MSSKSKVIGTAAESAVVKVLLPFWPSVERRALKGTLDEGDITGTPGIVWEVKGGAAAKTASDGQIEAWLDETEKERSNANADVGVLVVQRKGIGYPNAGRWWAVFRNITVSPWFPGCVASAPMVRLYLLDACKVLKEWGY